METLVNSAELMGWFDKQFKIKASTVETYISDFELVYGTSMQQEVNVLVDPVEGKQRITFIEDGDKMNLYFELEVRILNPLNERQDAATVILEVVADVELDVDIDYRLTGKLIDIDMKVLDFKPYYFTHTTK